MNKVKCSLNNSITKFNGKSSLEPIKYYSLFSTQEWKQQTLIMFRIFKEQDC